MNAAATNEAAEEIHKDDPSNFGQSFDLANRRPTDEYASVGR